MEIYTQSKHIEHLKTLNPKKDMKKLNRSKN
jgi:hypothetical protein